MTRTATPPADALVASLKAIADHSFDSIMITRAGKGSPIVYVNKAFTALTGYSARSVIGKSPMLLQGPATERAPLDALRRCMEHQLRQQEKTLRHALARRAREAGERKARGVLHRHSAQGHHGVRGRGLSGLCASRRCEGSGMGEVLHAASHADRCVNPASDVRCQPRGRSVPRVWSTAMPALRNSRESRPPDRGCARRPSPEPR